MSSLGNFQNGQTAVELDEIELPSESDLAILNAIGSDNDTQNLSFQGIKRKLGLHQESLSRSLHRLQRDGFVERLEHAYRISQKGLETLTHEGNRIPSKIERSESYSVPILRAMLPEHIDVRSLSDSLSYRWFGNLRWLGSMQTDDSTTLSWITNDTGLKLSVKMKDGSLSIETFPLSSSSRSEAIRSAYDLFDQVWKALKSAEKSPESRNYGRAA